MAWYPGAIRMELQPESDAQPAIRPTQLIVHSIVAPWDERRTYEYWRDSTNLESHFGLGYDGDLAQYLPTTVRADANAAANRRSDGTGAISVETASNTSATDGWTPEQVEALIRLGVWLHERHGIPLRICRSHDDPGYGYHRLFREWSTSGTACPGDARIKQFREQVFPGIVARAQGSPAVPPDQQQEDAMPQYTGLGTDWLSVPSAMWVTPRWTAEWADGPGDHVEGGRVVLHGPAQYAGSVGLRVEGLPVGGVLTVATSEVELAGGEHLRDLATLGQVIGTGGDSYGVVPIDGMLAAGRGLRLRLLHEHSGPLRIRAYLRLHTWKG